MSNCGCRESKALYCCPKVTSLKVPAGPPNISAGMKLFCNRVLSINVKETGALIRYGAPYLEVGTNVNFTELNDNVLHVRTYERGVEDETYSCGTGVTAAAIAASYNQ